MAYIEGRHKDTTTDKKHKNGWRFSNYIFITDHFAFTKIAIRACDEEHAWKQARKFEKETGIKVIGLE